MIGKSDRPIQRTLIVTVGPVAEEVGQLVTRQLQEKTAPQEAVAVVSISSGAGMADDLAAGLLSISHTDLRTALAARGWLPIRVDEVIVYLVADISKAGVSLLDIVNHTRQLAQRLLGVNVSFLLLVLFPESDGEQVAASWQILQQQNHLFGRGVAVFGLSNEIGLRLSDQEALAQLCSQIVMALTLTPLRDAPEWLAELSGSANGNMSLGVKTWDWSPQVAQEHLAWEWVRQVIGQWLAYDANGNDLPADIFHWFNHQQLDPETLAQQLPYSQEVTPSIPDWGYPQPWHVHQQVNACQLSSTELSKISTAVEQIQQDAKDALTATTRSLLDNHPVMGIAFTGSWLKAFSYQLEDFQDTVAGRQARLEDLLTASSTAFEATQAELDSLLQDWPPPTITNWIRTFLSPWHWPELILQYRRLQDKGKQLVHQGRQLLDYQYQEETLSAIDETYTRLELDLQRLSLQVEEIGEMLRFLLGEIDEKVNKAGHQKELTNALWQSLEETWLYPQQETTDAARAIGGLGRQLNQLDDAILGALLDEGRKRMMDVGQMTAVCALLRLHTTPGAQNKWWQETMENALPLWPYDPAQLSDFERTNHNSLTLVCAPQANNLRERLNLPDTADQRWTASSDPTRIWVLRLRGGIPDGDLLPGNHHP